MQQLVKVHANVAQTIWWGQFSAQLFLPPANGAQKICQFSTQLFLPKLRTFHFKVKLGLQGDANCAQTIWWGQFSTPLFLPKLRDFHF